MPRRETHEASRSSVDLHSVLATYRDLLRAEEKSPYTIHLYAQTLRLLLSHPHGPIVALGQMTPKRWPIGKSALDRYADQTGNRELRMDLMMLRRPRPGPRRPIQIPDLDTWRRLGAAACRERPPWGCVLWLQLYSGLRIGDIMEIRREEIDTAATTGRTTMHQKGWAHRRRRDWIPGPLCQETVVWISENCRAPDDGRHSYSVLWQLAAGASKSLKAAALKVSQWIPKPWTPHTFRHAVPSYLYEQGYDLETIASITGHDNVETLRKFYIHVTTPRRTLAAQADLRRLLFGDMQTPDGGGP